MTPTEVMTMPEVTMDFGIFNGIINDLTSFNVVLFIIMAVAGYLIGSLNLSIVMSRGMGKDIREMGSGNAGTTNTLRTMGKGAAIMVFTFDFWKGALIPLLLKLVADEPWMPIFESTCFSMAYIYAIFAVVGHCYPVYYKFRGGKGIATAAGALLAISTPAALMAIVEFGIILLMFRYVSLASIVAVLNIPIFTYFVAPGEARLMTVTILIAALAIFKHSSNIKRLRDGNENPFFGKKKSEKKQSN